MKYYRLLPMLLLCSCAGNDIIYKNASYEWHEDRIVQGDYCAVAESPCRIVSDFQGENLVWECINDISSKPALSCVSPLELAVYNMAVDGSIRAVEPDGTLRTGVLWGGVWTRDVSYSILLGMSFAQPEASMESLKHKIGKHGQIIQDTGTGGAWPCSTDRQIWTVAAWELYKVTGDMDWLAQVYPVAKKSLEVDMASIYDPATGLVRGESSFIDWREQSYPRWMEPSDIYATLCIGTNAVHYEALNCAASMAAIMGDAESAQKFSAKAESLKQAINEHLWMDDKSYYAQYLGSRRGEGFIYDKCETLGQALSVLYGIADESRSTVLSQSVPSVDFGTPVFYPWIPDIPPYHNRAVWPFVQAFWMEASAKAGNEEGVLAAMGALNRAAMMYATNKENYVADTGDQNGTALNSDNQLWSVAGALSMTYKVLCGMSFEQDCLSFKPFVPRKLAAERKLSGFAYRGSMLDIEVDGYGDSIKTFYLDGKQCSEHKVPASLTGKHTVRIVMNDSFAKDIHARFENACNAPLMPVASLASSLYTWTAVEDAAYYCVYLDGKMMAKTEDTSFAVPQDWKGDLQVVAFSAADVPSFPSEPVYLGQNVSKGFREIRLEKNSAPFKLKVSVEEDGTYWLSWNYANGNGPVSTKSSCGIRNLYVDGKAAGQTVFPHRGKGDWNNWGWTYPVRLQLSKGEHELMLRFDPENENMDINKNAFALKGLRLEY